jgi:hypothetical protein
MNLRNGLVRRLQNNYNTLSHTQRTNLSTRIANGETAIRQKSVQIARTHGLRINTGKSLNRITTRLLTQLIMLRGGLSKNIVNANT